MSATVVAGKDVDPVTTAVVTSFGSWSDKPFVVVVLVSFLACAMASQGGAARGLYSLARDDVFPFSRHVRKVNARRAPLGGLIASTLVSGTALLLGMNATTIGSLIAFGTAATFLPFFLVSADGVCFSWRLARGRCGGRPWAGDGWATASREREWSRLRSRAGPLRSTGGCK